MNAFKCASLVEAKGMAVLGPFLKERSDGRLVLLDKGPLARALQQESFGDAILRAKDGSARSVEIKCEDRHTGNLFLETWSNKNLDSRDDYSRYGPNPGWLMTSRADLLFYYFLDVDRLYVIDMLKLKRWAFGHYQGKYQRGGRISDFREEPQGKYVQANDTWGRLVPLEVLAREIPSKEGGYRLFYPKQLEFFETELAEGAAEAAS